MTKRNAKPGLVDVKALLAGMGLLRAMGQSVVEATQEAEMVAAVGAEKGERTEGRLGYRAEATT